MMLCPKPKLAKTNNNIRSPSFSMEIPSRQDKKVYVHYNHTDPCSHARWTARECYDFMYQRKWKLVADFYSGLVNGQFSLSNLFGSERQVSQKTSTRDDAEDLGASEERKVVNGKDKSGRWARMNFKIVLSYHGGSFDGWQKQPDLNTVQGLVEKSLGRFVDDRKVKQLMDKSLPVEGCAIVAGRTDKGVTALQQVCSFYTWRKDVSSVDIEEVINSIAPGQIRAVCVSEVSRAFHPNFSSKWRRYLYIFPIDDDEEEVEDGGEKTISIARTCNGEELKSLCNGEIKKINDYVASNDEEEVGGNKPRRFSIIRVNQLLKQLEGKSLSYRMFARDTKASRSMGPPTECFVFHARAAEARLPHTSNQVSDHPSKKQFQFGEGVQVLCVELVANRFLRKMVRVLVATSIREAAAGAEEDALLKLMDATCRRATAPPAPPDGLCLVDVGYSDFRPEICFIS